MNSMPASAPPSARATGRILVVDDEPHVLAVAKAILESQGLEVTTCESGDAAIEQISSALYAQQRFSVIILDLTMPGGMSGFEVMDAITTLDPEASVIACSGYFQEDARVLCQAIGFSDVLQKPYAMEHLCTTVRRYLMRDRSSAMPSL